MGGALSYQFDFDSRNSILRCRIKGHVTDEIIKEYYFVAADCFAQVCPLRGVFDLSTVVSFEISAQAIRELASRAPVMPDPSRVRVIVAPSNNMFALARMFQFEGAGTRPNLHVVHTLREAWEILGVHRPQFERLSDEVMAGAAASR